MIDFIGDIHGHADKLEALLKKLGYSNTNGSYRHPERKVIFVGDYIDRGPNIKETLRIVRNMVENDNAIALMGNHEYNAICYHTEISNYEYLREHSEKNTSQHCETLKQLINPDELKSYIDWFKTLPLFYETENFRAVHACWDEQSITELITLMPDGRMTDELIYESVKKGTKLFQAIENTLKGKELKLPSKAKIEDKDGHLRNDIRIKWWEDPAKSDYKSISVEGYTNLPNEVVDVYSLVNADYYKENEKAVFFGHYWLEGHPVLFRDNICCIDYSVAKKGKLVAYRFDGEKKLVNNNLLSV